MIDVACKGKKCTNTQDALFFSQAITEIHTSLKPFLDSNPKYKKAWEILQVPERVIQFR